MHYLIDGYNLLFRILDKGDEVQEARESMIEDISKKVNFTELKTTIVFDSKYQSGPSSTSHDGFLEVVYTDEGETADDWLIKEAKKLPLKAQETVVTSDKRLAHQIRIKGVQTLACEDFMTYLNKKVRTCIKQSKKVDEPLPPPPQSVKVKIPKGSKEYYEELFEKRLAEAPVKKENISSKVVKETKISKKIKTPFKEPKRSDESELERWQRLFDKNT